MRYKEELSRPFDEATTFLNSIESQLSNLCKVTSSTTSTTTGNEQSGRRALSLSHFKVILPWVSTLSLWWGLAFRACTDFETTCAVFAPGFSVNVLEM